MEWQREVRKKNGKPRKQFLEWWVPPVLREELGLLDGSKCSVTLSLAGYSYSRVYVLTSGGEFRVPKTVAERLQELAAINPTSQIVFDIQAATQENSILDGVEHPDRGEDTREPWSSVEVKATVSDYFDMLRAELEGTPYSKTAHRNALLKRLPKRSAQGVEFKHCNISAVLRDMNLTYIGGYKPRGNYQDLLAETVEDYLIANPEPRHEIVELDGAPADASPDGSRFVLAEIEVPPPQPAESRRQQPVKPFKTDWSAVTAHSRKLGEQGERFVFDLERRRLRDAGRLDLEARIEWVSQTRGDGAGYDIRSFQITGEEILIEVKTTKGPEGTGFYVTANELRCSEERGSAYKLYRVFQFGSSPKLYQLDGPLASVLNLEPRVYSAQCKGTATR